MDINLLYFILFLFYVIRESLFSWIKRNKNMMFIYFQFIILAYVLHDIQAS